VTAKRPDMQKNRITGFFLENRLHWQFEKSGKKFLQMTILGYNFIYVQKHINLLKPTGYAMHQQFNIQQLYALPTLY
jgi:hypothetical protein